MARGTIQMFTDGACSGNPGPGGYGVILRYGDNEKTISQGFRSTTNNRMELLAVIVGLEAIKWKNADIEIYSDSTYVVNAVTKGWLERWVLTGFKGKANVDLWERYLKCAQGHNLRYIWVKGHAGHPENVRCDSMAVAAYRSGDLAEDDA